MILFVFWFVQFILPFTREVMIYVYLAWCVVEIAKLLLSRKAPEAWHCFRRTLAQRFA